MPNNFLNQGGRYGSQGYPTRRAPLAIDLATPTYALTQQMIKRKKEELAGKKDQISANMKAVLEGLDFESVKGLGTKIRETHLEKLQELDTKWTEKLVEKGGFLSAAERQQLQGDKEVIEQDIANMRQNVESFGKSQELFATDLGKAPGQEVFDHQATQENFANYKDFVGGDKDPMQMLVKRVETPEEVIERLHGDFLDTQAKEFIGKYVGETEDGIIKYTESNRAALQNFGKRVKATLVSDQRFAQAIKKHGQEKVSAAMDAAITRRIGAAGGFQQKSGYGRGTDRDFSSNVHSLNLFLHGLLKRDKSTFGQAKTLGVGEDIIYDDRTDSLVIRRAGKTIKMPLPKKDATDEELKQWKLSFMKRIPFSVGDLPDDVAKFIEGDYSEKAKDIRIEKATSYSEGYLRSQLASPKIVETDDKGKKIDVPFENMDSDQKSKWVDEMAEYIKRVVPEENIPEDLVENKRAWLIGELKNKRVKFNLIDKDGKKISFDTREKAGREKLLKFIDEVNIDKEPAPAKLTAGSLDEL